MGGGVRGGYVGGGARVSSGLHYSRPGYGSYYRPGYYGRSYYRPYFYGGFYYNPFSWYGSYNYPYYGYPSVYDPAPEYYGSYAGSGPTVIVNQEPGPSVREYGAAAPRINGEEVFYLLALDDQTVRMAVAYWVEGSTLHYVDRNRQQHALPLSRIDRGLSEQLNRERRVTFQLPH